MPTYRTPGVVLKRTNLGEADRILTILTPHYGKLKAVARGVRKIGSRLAGHLEPFRETELFLAKGRSMEVVAGARLRGTGELGEEWQQLAMAYLVGEMADKLTEEAQPMPELYALVVEAYGDIAGSGGDALTELRYKLGLLESLGYRPELEVCRACGKALQAGERYWLNPELGGIVDGICRRGGWELSEPQVKLWRLALTHQAVKLRQVDGGADLAKESLPAVDAFYDYVFGKRFKSATILKS